MSPGCAGYSALLVVAGGLHELACGSNNASRNPRPACAARRRRGRGEKRLILKGSTSQVATGPDQSVKFIRMVFGGRAGKLRRFSRAPSEALSSGEGPGAVGEDCLRFGAAKPSSAAARRFEQRKGVGVADRVSWGRLLFGYFFLAKQEKVRPPVNGGTQRIRKQTLHTKRKTRRFRKPRPPFSGRKQRISKPRPPVSSEIPHFRKPHLRLNC